MADKREIPADDPGRTTPLTPPSAPPAPEHPRSIGPYRILGVLGKGGFGIVYLAEQLRPIRRRVALKLLRVGMDTGEVLTRFESERQALALMSHPNIAKVHDAGATDGGRPYFVMEWVAGEPITRYCDEHRLGIRSRLRLFIRVCEGVQHAHQKGVIHRDLKPSNVLVTEQDREAVPKIIDFGVAKSIEQRLSAETLRTRTGQLIGTPDYMSPEQADLDGLDIDTRTDVYALGVLLYELLAGVLPIDRRDLARPGFDELLRKIREDSPRRPSTRITSASRAASEVATKRRSTSRGLARRLRGDLDWIAMKALEKDRTRRYASVSELAADIARHLDHEPVLAGPPSRRYRLKKFLRRHRGPVAAVAAVIVTLSVGLAASMVQLARIRALERDVVAERDEVVKEAANTEDVNDFFEWTLNSADPFRSGKDVPFVEVLRNATEEIRNRFEGKPEIKASIRRMIGDTFHNIGWLRDAEPLVRASYGFYRETFGEEDARTISAMRDLGRLLFDMGRLDEAETLCRNGIGLASRILGSEDPETLELRSNLGLILQARGRLDEAESSYREILEIRRRVLGEKDSATLDSMYSVARVLQDRNRLEEAEKIFRRTLGLQRETLGTEHPRTFTTMDQLAQLLRERGDLPAAEGFAREAFEARRKALGMEHRQTATSMITLALILEEEGKHEESEPLFYEALEVLRDTLGEEHPDTLTAANNLAVMLAERGKLGEAESLLRRILEIQRRVHGEAAPGAFEYTKNVFDVLWAQGKFAAAEALLREASSEWRKALGEDHPYTLWSMDRLAASIREQGRLEEAADLFGAVLVATLERVLAQGGEGEPEELEPLWRRAVLQSPGDMLASLARLASRLRKQGRFEQARALLEPVVRAARITMPGTWESGSYLRSYGSCLAALERFEEGEARLLESIAILSKALRRNHRRTRGAIAALAELYDAWGKPGRAERWRANMSSPERLLSGS